MPGPRVLSGAVAAALVAAGAAATAQATRRHSRVTDEVQRRLADTTYQRLGDIGSVEALSVLPLVDRQVQRPELRGEPGVSYLVQAGHERLLFDTGLNLLGRSRSALVDNAEALGVDLAQVPAVVLSHQHQDHVGGVRAQRAGTFAFAGDPVEPKGLVAYAPLPLTHPSAEVRVTTRTTILAPGIAVLPPLQAALFWDGRPVLEQALAVNVRGLGLVLVSGCGHPGAPAMLDLVQQVLEIPLHGVIGGLHLPVHPWPRHLPQALLGSPRPPWRPLSDPDIDAAVRRLRAAGASLVAVSGHDSTPHTMGRFAAAFGPGFREIRVGDEIRIQRREGGRPALLH
jgi:7,8-dihydropterin-6-yl-methyl-4-(beta-D-ribofuranosyl)aminobenzene 5'-phosphate synthase